MAMRFASSSLEGKRVIVTGAARGLGAETAIQLAERGAVVSIVGLEAEHLAQLRDRLGGPHLAFTADVTNQAQLESAFRQTVERLGGLDAVVANAGVGNTTPLAVGSADAHARTIDINLGGALRTASCAFPWLKASGGYIVFIASVGSFSVMPGMATYCATKAGLDSLATGLRMEWRHHGVQVGTVHPTFINTDLVRDTDADSPTFERLRSSLPGPLGATLDVSDVAKVVVTSVARRKRRAYAPRSLGVISAGRSLMTSSLGERILDWQLDLRHSLPKWESETLGTGREFGVHMPGLEHLDGNRDPGV